MARLGSVTYDPVATVGNTMNIPFNVVQMDTTNLRITFTVPPSGNVFVTARGVVYSPSSATAPQWLMAVMDGSTVVKRVAVRQRYGGAQSLTTFINWSGSFVVTGLTPGASLTWDLAQQCETGVSGSTIQRGGPNNATTQNDAFGATVFEVWGVD